MSKLSVVISAHNEEKRIAVCLESVKFADEVVLVDNSSTDSTSKIAKRYEVKIFKQENDPLKLDILKNLGFEKATGDWILSIDADETVSKDLAQEIKETIKTADKNAYFIPRKNIMFGKWIKNNKGWYPDYQLRLFKKGSGKYTQKHVHEQLEVNGEKGYLKNDIIHENSKTIAEFVNKHIFTYAPNEAETLLEHGYVFSKFDAVRFPAREFLNWFFAREGYKDGLHGLMLAILMAFYHFAVFAYIWEKKDFVDVNTPEFLEETEGEVKKINKDIAFWFYNEKIKSIKNPVNKNLQRILRKIPR